jgi:pimeloyl-ACP methyl ester carboxylesterase
MSLFNRAARLGKRRVVLAPAALVVISVLGAIAAHIGPAQAGTAARRAETATSPSKPSIVLVHGAWADSGSWDAVVLRLQNAGYTVYVPPNPLRGLSYDSESIADFIAPIEGPIEGPIVLVGHSYGGAVITNAATGNSQVKALVYVDAFIPSEGDTISGLIHDPSSCFAVSDLRTVFDFVAFPGAPSGVYDAYVKQSVFPGCFANGLPASEGKVLAATQRPLATSALVDQSGAPAWETIPSWAVIGTDDHVIPEADQLSMANNAGAHITKVDAPHLSMISDPDVVARVIIRAARAAT